MNRASLVQPSDPNLPIGTESPLSEPLKYAANPAIGTPLFGNGKQICERRQQVPGVMMRWGNWW